MRILWADDQEDVARTLSTLLSADNEITYVTNGEDSLAQLAARSFDIAIVDLAMPPGEWGGLWLLEQIKLQGHDVPVLILSGEGSQKETIEAMRMGADYVRKDDAQRELSDRVLAIVQTAAQERRSNTETADLIALLESQQVEFKQTARLNIHTGRHDREMEQAVVKTIAGFMNAYGGALLIGVTDSGEVFGIEADCQTLGKRQDRDGFEQWLNTLLYRALGPSATSVVRLRFDSFLQGTVCRADVEPGKSPTFVRGGKTDADFYVRLGNQTRLLNTEEALDYVRHHWRVS